MSDRRTSVLQGREFSRRADKPIFSYVARRIEDSAGRGYPISLSLVRCAPPAPPAAPHDPIDARRLERWRMADEALADAVRLARLTPRYEAYA